MSDSLRRLLAWVMWCWIAMFTFLGLDHAIGDGDECTHALGLRTMMRTGEYLHLFFRGVETLERPLLPYWLAAPFVGLLGNEVGHRLSAAIASFGTLLVIFQAARSWWQRVDVAFVAVLLLAGSPSFHAYSRALMSDPPMFFAISLAITGAVSSLRDPRALTWVGLGVGLAIACKSLVALVPAVGLLPWVLPSFVRKADNSTRLRACAWFAATALPYYVLGFALHGARFGHEHFMVSLASRAADSFGIGMPGGVLAYARWIPATEGPWTAGWLIVGSIGAVIAGLLRRRHDLTLLGSYSVFVFVMMSMLATRLPHYVLPAYPAAALGAAGVYGVATQSVTFTSSRFGFLVGPALAMFVLLASRVYPGGNQYLLQSEAGRELGRIAAAQAAPGQTLYAYEWLGKSLGYYADRPLMLLTADRKRYAVVSKFIRQTTLVPPAPEPVGSKILIAGHAQVLSQTKWLKVDEVIGFSAPYFLARAHIVQTQ